METTDQTPDFGAARFSPTYLLDPYPLYAGLRRQPGLVFSRALGMWLVSRYKDVASVLRSPAQFSSQMILRPTTERTPEVQALLDENGYTTHLPLLGDDPPVHARLRSLVSRAFVPQRVTALQPRIREWIDELLVDFSGPQPVDPIARLAVPLPMRVMCELIGVPQEDLPRVRDYSDAAALFQSGRLSPSDLLACAQKVIDYRRYVRELVQTRERKDGGDLLSALLTERDKEPGTALVSAEEVVGLGIVFLFAGHKTTTGLIGNALLHLLRRPALWRALGEDETLRERAVNEVLRFDAPVQGMVRTATEPVYIGNTELPAQSKLLVLFAAANRDEQVFPDPDELDVERRNSDEHLAFGRGIHFCAGAALARLEARLILEALCQRFPCARLLPVEEAPLTYSPNLIHRCPQRLQVVWQ